VREGRERVELCNRVRGRGKEKGGERECMRKRESGNHSSHYYKGNNEVRLKLEKQPLIFFLHNHFL
jgi:hypothetical protein